MGNIAETSQVVKDEFSPSQLWFDSKPLNPCYDTAPAPPPWPEHAKLIWIEDADGRRRWHLKTYYLNWLIAISKAGHPPETAWLYDWSPETGRLERPQIGGGGGLTSPQSELERRGILSAAESMGWEDLPGGKGWRYPAPDRDGQMVMARKRFLKRKPKTLWISGVKRKRGIKYYHHPDMKSAIAAADGIVHIVNGEPAVLTMLEAGLVNALCWYGETNVPRTLKSDLSDFGATDVVFYADNDKTGRRVAQKVVDALSGSGLRVEVRSLELESPGADVNDIWITSGFHIDWFINRLKHLPTKALAPTGRPRNTEWVDAAPADDEFIAQVVRAIIAASPTEYPKRNGDNLLLRSPFRDDKEPSFSINTKSGLANDFGGRGYNADQLAELLGVAPRRRSFVKRGRAMAKQRRPQVHEVKPEHTHKHLHKPGQRGNGLDFVTSIDRNRYEWMTDALSHIPRGYRDIAFCAPKGMGKTVAISEMAAEHRNLGRSIMFVSFLTENVRHAARVMDLDLYSGLALELKGGRYENLSDISPYIATTLNSLNKLANDDGEINKRDVLIIDELNEVVDALTGKLLNKRERMTFRLFRDAIRQADFVIVSGADIRRLDMEFIRAIRGKPFHLIDPELPKTLPIITQFAERQRLIEAALNEAAKGLVIMPVDSKPTAESIARLAQSKGITESLIIDAERSNTEDVNAFLKDPTKEAPRYNLILFTTKMSSGVSINAEANVRAVYGQFGHGQIGAETASQMMHRVRHAKIYGFYCHSSEAGPPRDDWRGYRNDWMTNLTDNGFEADDVLEELADVAAKNRHWSAHSRYQKADRIRQLELYQGHRRVLLDERKPERNMTDELKAIGQAVKDEKKTRVMNAERISPKELRGLAAAGQDMPEHHDGRLRDEIESVTRRDINDDLYDRYKSPVARLGLMNGRNQLTDTEKLRAKDEREQQFKKPIHRRGNFVQKQAVARDLMRALTGIDDFDKAVDWLTERKHYIPAPILESKMKDWWPANKERVRRLFDIDHRSSDKPSSIVKLILRRVGLDIEGKRKRITKKMFQNVYKGPLLEEMEHFAKTGELTYAYGISTEVAAQWRTDIEAQADEGAPAPSAESAPPAKSNGKAPRLPRCGKVTIHKPTAYKPGSDNRIDDIPF